MEIQSTIGLWDSYLVCDHGVKCPAQAGVRQSLSVSLDKIRLTRGRSGQVKFEIIHYPSNGTGVELYCVAFLAKVV